MGPLGESGVADLVGGLRARWPGRPIYLCGGSMGGSSALIFTIRRPDIVDGVIALCPAADIGSYYTYAAASTSDVLRNIAAAIRIHYQADGHDLASELSARSVVRHADRLNAPVYLSHGTADSTIPVEATRALAVRLRELARPVRYIEIPEGDHDAPAYALEWADALDFVAAVR